MSGTCSCTALRKSSRRLSQLYDAALAPCGLRTTQRAILNHIQRAGTPQIGELAAALVMDRGALTHTLKPLERDGLVAVGVDPKDRRNRLIALTEAGAAKLAESEPYWEAAQRGFDSAFGTEAAAALRTALGIIASNAFEAAFAKAGA